MNRSNSQLDLLITRKSLVQDVIDLTTGPDEDQIEENIREIKEAVARIKAKQPYAGISVRRHVDRFFASIRTA